mmetsp:Transcript_15514/g.32773  ORF Transcript_15514/g.32773 Transcript_15514/m.32773 type:complete len:222 (-) Transcript_15514:599-1264(-)
MRRLPIHVSEVTTRGPRLLDLASECVHEHHLVPIHAHKSDRVLVSLILAGELMGHLDEHALSQITRPVLVFDGQEDFTACPAPHGVVCCALLRHITSLDFELRKFHDLVVFRQGTHGVHGLGEPRGAHFLQLAGGAGELYSPELAWVVPHDSLLEVLHLRGPLHAPDGPFLPTIFWQGLPIRAIEIHKAFPVPSAGHAADFGRAVDFGCIPCRRLDVLARP